MSNRERLRSSFTGGWYMHCIQVEYLGWVRSNRSNKEMLKEGLAWGWYKYCRKVQCRVKRNTEEWWKSELTGGWNMHCFQVEYLGWLMSESSNFIEFKSGLTWGWEKL